MRIGAYTQIQQVYNTTKPAKVSKTQKKGFSDALSETPDIRTEIVNDIKAQIDAGTYGVSGDSFADKLLEKFNQGSLAL